MNPRLMPLVALLTVVVLFFAGYLLILPQPRHVAPHLTPARPTPTAAPVTTPVTVLVEGKLLRYEQQVLELATAQGRVAIVYAQATTLLASCGRLPTLQSGEDLAVRLPPPGGGVLLALSIAPPAHCH